MTGGPQDGDLLDLLIEALEPVLGEIELLQTAPRRDDSQFERSDGTRPVPLPDVQRLTAWLYAPGRRVAVAVHATGWTPPASDPRENWDALLRGHFHAPARTGWTTPGAVAMPLHPPFDEPGLRIQPLLALRAAVSAGEHYLSETMTTSIRRGHPHVVPVQVFSAALFEQSRPNAARSSFLTIAHEL